MSAPPDYQALADEGERYITDRTPINPWQAVQTRDDLIERMAIALRYAAQEREALEPAPSAPAGDMKHDDPYFVEVDVGGCERCSHSKTYTVVGPDGDAVGRSFKDSEAAEDLASDMNTAYAAGREAAARIAAPRTSRIAELESAVDAADRILAMFIEKRLPVEAWQDWRRTHRAALCDPPTAPGAEKGTNDERAGSTRAEGSASDQGHVGHLDHIAGAERGQPTQPSRREGAAGDPERSVAPRDAALRALVETWRKASRDLAADTPMARGQVRVLRLVADELDATLAALPPEVCSECGHSLKQHGRLGCGFSSCDCGISGERR